MNPANEGNNSNDSPALPVKRKRGRPRKDQSPNLVETVPVPPGHGTLHVNQPHQEEPIDDSYNGKVGQTVAGVVEAAFGAGYFLNVKIGNSNISLRGIVFKPGHSAPVTAENDIAPDVQMIVSNEVPLPQERQIQVRGTNQAHRLAYRTANLAASKSKHVSLVAAPSVPPVGARGTVVPVILQPVSLLSGLSPANQAPLAASKAAHLLVSEDKHVHSVAPLAVLPPDGSTPKQILEIANQALNLRPQISNIVRPKTENGPLNQGTPKVWKREQAMSTETTNMAPSCVVERVSESFPHVETSNTAVAASKLSAEDSGVFPEQEIRGTNEALFVEPLQAMESNVHNQLATISRRVGPFGD